MDGNFGVDTTETKPLFFKINSEPTKNKRTSSDIKSQKISNEMILPKTANFRVNSSNEVGEDSVAFISDNESSQVS